MITRGSASCSGVQSISVEAGRTANVGVSHEPVMKVTNLSVNGKKHWPTVCAWLRASRPHIVTLQKIGPEEHFPTHELRDIGYEIEALPWRSRSDPGVAILTQHESQKQVVCVRRLPGAESDESRFLTIRVGDLWVSSVYAPYGPPPCDGEVPRPPYKRAIERRVAWLHRLRDHVDEEGYGSRDALLCGDFNVKVRDDGPLETWERFYSSKEQDALQKILDLGFVDAYRHLHFDRHKNPGRTYGHHRRPGGISRLHLILASQRMEERLQDACVDPDAMPGKPSIPLVVTWNRVGA